MQEQLAPHLQTQALLMPGAHASLAGEQPGALVKDFGAHQLGLPASMYVGRPDKLPRGPHLQSESQLHVLLAHALQPGWPSACPQHAHSGPHLQLPCAADISLSAGTPQAAQRLVVKHRLTLVQEQLPSEHLVQVMAGCRAVLHAREHSVAGRAG